MLAILFSMRFIEFAYYGIERLYIQFNISSCPSFRAVLEYRFSFRSLTYSFTLFRTTYSHFWRPRMEQHEQPALYLRHSKLLGALMLCRGLYIFGTDFHPPHIRALRHIFFIYTHIYTYLTHVCFGKKRPCFSYTKNVFCFTGKSRSLDIALALKNKRSAIHTFEVPTEYKQTTTRIHIRKTAARMKLKKLSSNN